VTSEPGILVGIDGSSRGDDALAFATALARALRTGLLLVHAYGPAGGREQAQAILAERRERDADVPVDVLAYADPVPARALRRVAAAHRAAVIVVGPSHRAGFGLVLPGGTGQQLLAEAARPVAVVPRGWRPAEDARLHHVGVGYDGTAESRAGGHRRPRGAPVRRHPGRSAHAPPARRRRPARAARPTRRRASRRACRRVRE
jgi:nucleotide-binding universal stress UspA family protein